MENEKAFTPSASLKASPLASQPSILLFQSSPLPLFPLLLYTLLTLCLTYPLLFNLTHAVPNDIGDPLLNTWILAWNSHALLTEPLGLFDANIFYPLPKTLAYSEHLFSTALLALPLQLITAEPITAYNLSLLLSFPLAAFGMYLLTLRWTCSRAAAFIAGLIFGFAPYRFAAIAHLQLLTVQWLPFTMLFLDLLLAPRRRPKLSFAAGLLLMLTLQVLASWYLAVYTGVIVAIYLVTTVAINRFMSHPNRATVPFLHRPFALPRLLLLSAIFVVSLLLILPLALPYLALLEALAESRPLAQALTLAAVPTDYLAAAPFNTWFGPLTAPLRQRSFFSEENTLFLGLVASGLASLSLITSLGRRHGANRFNAQNLTPVIGLSSIFLFCLALTFASPYAALAQLFPPSAVIRVPARWVIPALFALAGLAAFGYAGLTRRLRPKRAPTSDRRSPLAKPPNRQISDLQIFKSSISNPPFLLFIVTSCLLMVEALHLPLPLAAVENRGRLNPVYAWLAAQPSDFALIELPLHAAPDPEFPEVKRLYASTLGWWPLVNGYSGYTPPRQIHLGQALKSFPDQAAIAALQSLVPPSDPATARHDEQLARNNGQLEIHNSPFPLLLLLHPGEAPFDRTRWETVDRWQAERNPALQPLGQFNGDYLYRLLPAEATRFDHSPLATFGPDQAIQLLAMKNEKLTNSHGIPPPSPFPILNSPFSIHPSQFPTLLLYWRTTTSLTAPYTIFIHFRAADGSVISQADGPPVSNRYPTTAWQPGEIIQDVHSLPGLDLASIDHLAVGLYHPASGERLPAYGPDGQRLVDDAVRAPLR